MAGFLGKDSPSQKESAAEKAPQLWDLLK